MTQYIPKSVLVAEIERIKKEECPTDTYEGRCKLFWIEQFLSFIDTLEVKEVDLDAMQRMEECPYRQVGCTMYEGHILECKGACSWVVDYPKLKELKAQKRE